MVTDNRVVSAPAETRPVRPGWTLGLVAVCAFLTSLDVMVVVTALPTIRTDLGAKLSDLEWTVNAYNLAFACVMLIGYVVGDRFGRRKLYVIGLVMFAVASGLAASTSSVDVLILARVLQGVAAGLAIPVSLTLLSDAFPPERLGGAMGVWGGVSGLAVAAGPVVGGVITQSLSWHWIFWINVPISLVAAVLSAVLLRESRGPRPRMDLVGLVFVSLGLLALVWAAVRAPSAGWGSGDVVAELVAGVVLLAAFIWWEARFEHPLLPLQYFRNRGFTVANGSAFLQHFALIGSLFMVSQLLQIGLGNDALGTGLRMLAWTAPVIVVAPIAGGLADKLGSRPFMVGGLLLQGIGLIWVGLLSKPGVGFLGLLVPLILSGVGIAMALPTTVSLVFSSVPPQDAGVASGVNNAVRELGGVFGVTFLSVTFAAYGSYLGPAQALHGFRAALILGGAASLVGMLIASRAPGRPPASVADPTPRVAVDVSEAG